MGAISNTLIRSLSGVIVTTGVMLMSLSWEEILQITYPKLDVNLSSGRKDQLRPQNF